MTDWDRLARPSLRGLERYDPGPSRDDMRQRHGLAALEPLNWNEDLFGPPPEAIEAAAAELRNVAYYPERAFADFRNAVAAYLDLPPAAIIPAHGAQALIATIAAAFVESGSTVVVPSPTYGLYAQVCAAAGARVVRVPGDGYQHDLEGLAEAAREHGAHMVWLSDPNNPTGSLVDRGRWSRFLDALPEGCAVVADEAYMDFAEPELRADRFRDVLEGRPVIALRSFSKTFGLAGLRLGFAVADPRVARLLDIVQEPFNVNRVALAAGRAALAVPGFVEARRAEVAEARDLLRSDLGERGLTTYESHANFVLVELGVDDGPVCEALLAQGVLIRPGTEFGLPGFVRVTVARPPVMRRAAALIADAVAAN
jgi:histidinol-phosphate aminotransferase